VHFLGSILSTTRWDYSNDRVSKIVVILTLPQVKKLQVLSCPYRNTCLYMAPKRKIERSVSPSVGRHLHL
jgi:hypothetical protein